MIIIIINIIVWTDERMMLDVVVLLAGQWLEIGMHQNELFFAGRQSLHDCGGRRSVSRRRKEPFEDSLHFRFVLLNARRRLAQFGGKVEQAGPVMNASAAAAHCPDGAGRVRTQHVLDRGRLQQPL